MYTPVHINLIQNHQASGVFASLLEALVIPWIFLVYHFKLKYKVNIINIKSYLCSPLLNWSTSQELCTQSMVCYILLSSVTRWFYPYSSGLLFWHWGCPSASENLFKFINNKPALLQIMAWCQTGDKPLSGSMIAYSMDTYMYHWPSMCSSIGPLEIRWYNWISNFQTYIKDRHLGHFLSISNCPQMNATRPHWW